MPGRPAGREPPGRLSIHSQLVVPACKSRCDAVGHTWCSYGVRSIKGSKYVIRTALGRISGLGDGNSVKLPSEESNGHYTVGGGVFHTTSTRDGERRTWLSAKRDAGDNWADEEMTCVSQAEPSRRIRLLGIVGGLGVAQVVVLWMRDIGFAHWISGLIHALGERTPAPQLRIMEVGIDERRPFGSR